SRRLAWDRDPGADGPGIVRREGDDLLPDEVRLAGFRRRFPAQVRPVRGPVIRLIERLDRPHLLPALAVDRGLEFPELGRSAAAAFPFRWTDTSTRTQISPDPAVASPTTSPRL